ncbi:MAG TPA: sugar kinase, partial [Cellvibrionaceae bacterium]|nr:sugar kinase [Cellvibrionaceae bacterium]
RLGLEVGFFTRLGDDPYSAEAIATMAAEGLATSGVEVIPGRTAGLYMIANQANGERNFTFWRSQSPARDLFSSQRSLATFKQHLQQTQQVYFSGITLAILSEAARVEFFSLLQGFRAKGGRVVFDNNYRQALWPDQNSAQIAMQQALECADSALLTDDDYERLWGSAEFAQVLQRCRNAGVHEVVLKRGSDPVCVAWRVGQGELLTAEVAVPVVNDVIDTTAAGDSFNAGYLTARAQGQTPVKAAQFGSRCAAIVIRHRGAIVEREVFLAEFMQNQYYV